MSTTTKTKVKKWWSCKYDRVFKSVVVDEKDYTIMEAILSSIFGESIKIIQYHNTEMKVNTIYEKVRIADVLIESNGEYIHIEVETGTGISSKIKNFSTFTTFYNQNVVRGSVFDTKTKFLHISLQYGLSDYFPVKGMYYVMNPETNEKLIDNIEILCINMDKLKRMWENGINKARQYKYLIMLDLPRKELEAFESEDSIVEKYKKKVIDLNDSSKFQAMMSYEERTRLEHNTEKKLAYEEGLSSGISQGISVGEQQKQLEVAKKMLEDNIPLKTIIKYTTLTKKELENLRKNRNV